MADTGIVVQARVGSTRFPGKVVEPFDGDRGILDIILERLGGAFPGLPLIVATTRLDEDDAVAAVARARGAAVVRGDVDDVLSRFTAAAEEHGLERIVRVCADNPFVDPGITRELVRHHAANPDLDYVCHRMQSGAPAMKSHLGIFTESVRARALTGLAGSPERRCREHVTLCVYENPDRFRVEFLDAPGIVAGRNDIRLTIDTRADFLISREILATLKRFRTGWTLEQLVQAIDADPDRLRRMKREIERNVK